MQKGSMLWHKCKIDMDEEQEEQNHSGYSVNDIDPAPGLIRHQRRIAAPKNSVDFGEHDQPGAEDGEDGDGETRVNPFCQASYFAEESLE